MVEGCSSVIKAGDQLNCERYILQANLSVKLAQGIQK